MEKQTFNAFTGLPRFERLHVSFRLIFLVTCISLSVGYIFNMAQIWESHGGGENTKGILGISPDSIRAAYYGKRDSSTLESKLLGTMKGYATQKEKAAIIEWIRVGSPENSYNESITLNYKTTPPLHPLF